MVSTVCDNDMCSVDAIILASGLSNRMGSNKLLLPLGDSTVIDQFLKTFPYQLFQKVILVTANEEVGQIAKNHQTTICYNDNPAAGKSGSIQCGLTASTARDGIMFTVADQPFLTQEVIRKILDCFSSNHRRIVYPEVDGTPGNPVIFPTAFRANLMALQGNSGGRTLCKQFADKTLAVPFESAEIFMDIDTPQTYQDAVARWNKIHS